MTMTSDSPVIQALRRTVRDSPTVQAAILFGSVARGTAGDGSDVDVLIVTRGTAIGRLRRALHGIEAEHDVNVSPVFVRDGHFDGLDPQFLDSVLREGIPLKGEMPSVGARDLGMRPVRIVSLDTSRLPQKRKMELYRALEGFETVKRVGKVRYRSSKSGFLLTVGGWRVGRGALVIPERALPALEKLLDEHGAKRSMVAAWLSPS